MNENIDKNLTLFDFETKIINFPVENISETTEDLINEIQEDIAYTTTAGLTEEDIKNKLMSENNLKNKLKAYLT